MDARGRLYIQGHTNGCLWRSMDCLRTAIFSTIFVALTRRSMYASFSLGCLVQAYPKKSLGCRRSSLPWRGIVYAGD